MTLDVIEATGFHTIVFDMPWYGAIYLVITSVTLTVQDLTFFVDLKDGTFTSTTSLTQLHQPLMHFLLVAPSWSLALAPTFYNFAPFIVKRLGTVILFFLLSLGLRVIMIQNGYTFDPWTYHVFPTELVLFLAGSLSSHRFHGRWPGEPAWIAVIVAASSILAYPYIDLPNETRDLIVLACILVALPGMFRFNSDLAFDRHIGEFTYPTTYLRHMPVIQMIGTAFGQLNALAAHYLVVMRIEAIR